MKRAPRTAIDQALDWCSTELGAVEVMADHSKIHGGRESSTCRLHTSSGFCYLKVHQSRLHWQNEVHAYERWACAFGAFAPRLLAARDNAPLALVVSELPGKIMEGLQLPPAQGRTIWRTAGVALAALHQLEAGECFGPCTRDGTCVEAFPGDARDYVSQRFTGQIERAIQAGVVDDSELVTIRAAHDLIPVFEGERPLPCHRDYCAANWLIDAQGSWAGVIDFEFAHWDVRVADFSRDPDWSWIRRPDLVAAFFEGYGRSLTAAEEQQLLVAHAEYALGAILWGHEHAFYGFEQEGHAALAHLALLFGGSS
jgi:aminoglycoside phosphotransferase